MAQMRAARGRFLSHDAENMGCQAGRQSAGQEAPHGGGASGKKKGRGYPNPQPSAIGPDGGNVSRFLAHRQR